MAITPSYAHSTTMKKVNINNAIYWLKDEDLRTVVEAFGSAVYKDVETTFDAASENLATEKATATWLEEKIAGLSGAMHFEGVIEKTSESQTDREAIDAHYAAKPAVPKSGDVVIIKDSTLEYVCTGNTDPATIQGATWEEIGGQGVYATKAEVEANFVKKTTTIAGIDLADNITVAELEASTALNLKALSHKDSATGTVSTADSIDDITVAKAGEYTVSGETVAVPKTYNALDVTPAGTIDVKAGTAAAATYDKTSTATITATTVSEGQTANYTPAGTVTLPSISAGVTLSPVDVATVVSEGTAYSLTDGSVTKADDTTARFVKKAFDIAIDTTDAEQLNITAVTTDNTTYFADAVTAAGDVSYTKQTLTGALPTFGTQSVALTTGATASADYNGSATFSGTGTVLGANLGYETTSANVTQPTFTADFAGTTKSVTPTVATTENAQAPSGKITVTTETKTLTLNKTDKTVTVE